MGPYPKLMVEDNQMKTIRGIPTDIWVLHRWNEIFGDERDQYYGTDWEGGKTGEFTLDPKRLCTKDARCNHDYCQKIRYWFNLLMSGELTDLSGWPEGIQFIENFLFFVTSPAVAWAEVQQQGGGDWASSWSFGAPGSLRGWDQWRTTTLLENKGQAKHRGDKQWYNTPNVDNMIRTKMMFNQVRTPYTSLRLCALDGGHGYSGPREIQLSDIFQS